MNKSTMNWIGRAVCVGALVTMLPAAQAQRNRDNRGTAHFTFGETDKRPRFNDPDAIYIWRQGKTFFVAVGGAQRGSVFVRADVERGTIDDISHRREGGWSNERFTTNNGSGNGRNHRDNDRQFDERRWTGSDNEGVRRVSPDVIEYSTRAGSWDFVKFDVRRGNNIRFNFDAARNGNLQRTIYIGGEDNRRTRAESVVIDFDRR